MANDTCHLSWCNSSVPAVKLPHAPNMHALKTHWLRNSKNTLLLPDAMQCLLAFHTQVLAKVKVLQELPTSIAGRAGNSQSTHCLQMSTQQAMQHASLQGEHSFGCEGARLLCMSTLQSDQVLPRLLQESFLALAVVQEKRCKRERPEAQPDGCEHAQAEPVVRHAHAQHLHAHAARRQPHAHQLRGLRNLQPCAGSQHVHAVSPFSSPAGELSQAAHSPLTMHEASVPLETSHANACAALRKGKRVGA